MSAAREKLKQLEVKQQPKQIPKANVGSLGSNSVLNEAQKVFENLQKALHLGGERRKQNLR